MVTVTLPYGKGEVQFELPKERISAVLLPKDLPGAHDPYSVIRQALLEPVDGQGLSSLPKGPVTIVTDDYTRPTPSGVICKCIIDRLVELGADESQITILAAGGLHRPMTREELRSKFGNDLLKRIQIRTHDAWDEKGLEFLGQTSRGTPEWVNRLVAKASLRFTVGMITAHFVAGYGSGPKTIMPGASGYKTIFHNHGVVSVSPDAKMGATSGNPCWEDMLEVTRMLNPTLALDVVLNTRDEIVGAFHGSPESAQSAGLHLYNNIFGFHLKEKADIVVASANPMYSYLDQCLKAIIHASMVVKEGGARIVVSPCKELLGPDYLRKLYYSSLHPRWPTVVEYQEMMRSGKIEDIADAVGILKFLESNQSELTLVCNPSFDDDLNRLGLHHAGNVQVAVDEVVKKHGPEAKVTILPYGAVTHPVLD